MKRRFCQRAWLKPEKVEEYRRLHANAWPGVLDMIAQCNLQNYSIYIMDRLVVSPLHCFLRYCWNYRRLRRMTKG